jgi:hypothetical protein
VIFQNKTGACKTPAFRRRDFRAASTATNYPILTPSPKTVRRQTSGGKWIQNQGVKTRQLKISPAFHHSFS